MKVKNVLMAMVFSVAVLGGYQTYEQVSLTNVDSFLLENVEALASGGDDEPKFNESPEPKGDDCTVYVDGVTKHGRKAKCYDTTEDRYCTPGDCMI